MVICIYNNENKCRLEQISINELCMCEDCIIISFEKDFLEAEKKRQLKEIESRWEQAN
jgi:hypothetical protein